MYNTSRPAFPTHDRIARAMNSGPLSERMCAGAPRSWTTRASTSLTALGRIPSCRVEPPGPSTPACTLVHQREPLQGPPVRGPVMQEIPRPDVVLVLRWPPHATVGTRSQAPLFPLLPRHFQTLLPPEPIDPFAVDPPALTPQQCPDAPVAETRMPPHQLQHPRQQPLLLFPGFLRLLPLRRAGLLQHAASPTLGDAEGLLELPHSLPTLGGAHHFFWAIS